MWSLHWLVAGEAATVPRLPLCLERNHPVVEAAQHVRQREGGIRTREEGVRERVHRPAS